MITFDMIAGATDEELSDLSLDVDLYRLAQHYYETHHYSWALSLRIAVDKRELDIEGESETDEE